MSTDDPYPGPDTAPGGPSPRTTVLERELVEEQVVEPGDHELFAHYVIKLFFVESALSG